MKLKKIIAGICVATVSISVLTLTASAASTSFDKKAGNVPVHGTLSVTSSQVVATASIGDNPANYDTAQARVQTLDYIMQNTSNGLRISDSTSSLWGTGGSGCSVTPNTGYKIVSAKSHSEFNINGRTYSTSEYDLEANA